ncbi:MAG: phosphoenolpyruvate--protein phosphotransferase [Opitutales bacterium]
MEGPTARPEQILRGIAAAPGVATGPAYLMLAGMAKVPKHAVEDIEAELARLDQALATTRRQISELRDEVAGRLGAAEAEIFDAHLLVLEDGALVGEVAAMVKRDRLNIEHCFSTVADRYIEIFANLDDDFLRERASDIRDVTGRILDNLLGVSTRARRAGEPSAILAADLTPSDTASLPPGEVLAIATESGNRTSHSAIMARALEVPAVVGVHGLLSEVNPGDQVVVDGDQGIVVLHPSAATLERARIAAESAARRRAALLADNGGPDAGPDGGAFLLQANIGGPDDLDDADAARAAGVGLYRTENLFLRVDGWPDEATQSAEYAAVVRRAGGKPVTFRTLDIGGDKQLGDAEHEANPFMGFRALRLCLERPEIFRAQLRAMVRASSLGPISIMFPMVSGLDEVRRAKAAVRAVEAELAAEGVRPHAPIRLGVMIEIPSACVVADSLAAECDFFSVGTNDLVQYLLAVDRGNDRVASLYEPAHPAVIQTLRHVFRAARERGIPCGVCGELAGDAGWAALLLGLGADSLSMSTPALPEVRYVLRRSTRAEREALAAAALASTEPAMTTAALRAFAADRLRARA